jgi:hypothetical protein
MPTSGNTSQDQIAGWFAGRIPSDWFTGPLDIQADRDEVIVVGTLAEPELAPKSSDETKAAALASRISGHREDTRGQRMRIADEAQHKFGLKVSWGAACGDQRVLFTTLATPAMTRVRMPERRVLDTLVDAGVARSRSHALAWCVRLVAQRQDEWLKDLNEALEKVKAVRTEGPHD